MSVRGKCDGCDRSTVLMEINTIWGEASMCPECHGMGWDREKRDTVECPVCLFSFGAEHTDPDGGYTCPLCELQALGRAHERMAEAGPDRGVHTTPPATGSGGPPAEADGGGGVLPGEGGVKPKRYGVIIADPPWAYDRSANQGGVDRHYSTMTVEQIAALPVASLAAPDSVLLLWGTWPHVPGALKVMDGWGFHHVSGFPWIKIAGEPSVDLWGKLDIKSAWGVGYWVRGVSEFVLIGRRGKVSPPPQDFVGLLAPNIGHSRKPDSLHDYAETLPGPYLEMFARRARPGWDVWGNEAPGSIELPGAA